MLSISDSAGFGLLTWGRGFNRGRFRESFQAFWGPLGPHLMQPATLWQMLIALSILYPQYDSVAAVAADSLDWLVTWKPESIQRSPISEVVNARCHVQLFRTYQGDTVGVRAEIQGMRPGFLEANMEGVCPALVEAILESYGPGGPDSPALDRLESVIKRGAWWEIPLNAAIVEAARMRRKRGEYEQALVAARRCGHWRAQDLQNRVARLREEGDLAALVGDTAGAVSAYEDILRLWPDPDDLGQPLVDSVRSALSGLQAAWSGGAEPPKQEQPDLNPYALTLPPPTPERAEARAVGGLSSGGWRDV